jgi:hypothetical protein
MDLNMKKFFFSFLAAFIFGAGLPAQAQQISRSNHSTLSYDVSVSSGTYDNRTYSELQLGLNWYALDWLNWRNSVFQRFGSSDLDIVTGFDTAFLFTKDAVADGGTFGIQGFIGPGYRFATKDNSGAFAEAGLIFAAGPLRVGVGAKSLYYSNPRVDSTGRESPRNDNQVFFILAGSFGSGAGAPVF